MLFYELLDDSILSGCKPVPALRRSLTHFYDHAEMAQAQQVSGVEPSEVSLVSEQQCHGIHPPGVAEPLSSPLECSLYVVLFVIALPCVA